MGQGLVGACRGKAEHQPRSAQRYSTSSLPSTQTAPQGRSRCKAGVQAFVTAPLGMRMAVGSGQDTRLLSLSVSWLLSCGTVSLQSHQPSSGWISKWDVMTEGV